MKRLLASTWLVWLGLLCALLPVEASATHFRYGHITWKRSSATSRTVEFTVTGAWRINAVDPVTLNFGDGTASTLQATIVANSTDSRGEGYSIVRYQATKTYTSNSAFTAFLGSCCRISTLVNAPDASFRVESVVDLRDGSNLGSPVSSVPVILQLPRGGVRTFVLPIADPDGRGYSCRLSTSAEAGWGAASQPNAGGRAISISSGCLLSWDTSSANAGDKYAAQVMIESNDTPTADATRVALDFIIEITNQTTNAAPTCSGSTGTRTALVGVPFTATFTGTDANGGTLRLGHQGLPSGATLSPSTGTSAAVPFTSTFSWTPPLSAAGSTQAVLITYTDPGNLQGYCSLSIQVVNRQLAVALTPTGPVRQVIEFNHPTPQTVTFPLVVENRGTGDATDSYTVRVFGGLSGWTAAVAPDDITLVPGETRPVTLTVTAPPGLPEALPVEMTVVVTSRTNPAITSSVKLTTYTNPPPPVTGLATQVTFIQGPGVNVTTRLQPTRLSARVTTANGTVTGPGKGVVTFQVAGRAVGTDRDADGDGVYAVDWVPGFGWNQLGAQELLAVYSGIDLPEGQDDLMPSQRAASLTVSQPVDSDGDGLSDEQEGVLGTNPNNADTDGDGLSDGNEVIQRGTNPLDPDTDGDGFNDGAEVVRGTDPLNPDTDGDGFSDGEEIAAGCDPLDPNSVPVRRVQVTVTGPANGSVFSPSSSASTATTANVVISGTVDGPCVVNIYDNGVLIDSFPVSGAGPWSRPAGLSLSGHSITVTATNGAGSSSAGPATSVTVLPNAPTLLSSPPAIINATQSTVSWNVQTVPGLDLVVTVEDPHHGSGEVAGGVFTAGPDGTVVVTLPRMPDCHPIIRFYPRLPSGQRGPPVQQRVYVDSTAPVLACPGSIDAPWQTGPTVFSVGASDTGSHVPNNVLTYLWTVTAPDGTVSQSSGASHSAVLAPGGYSVQVTVTDRAGNSASCSAAAVIRKHATVCSLPALTAPSKSVLSASGSVGDATLGVSLGSDLSGLISYLVDGQPVSSLESYFVAQDPGSFAVQMAFAGNELYEPCQASSTLTVTEYASIAPDVTLCELPRYTNQKQQGGCGWVTTGAFGSPIVSAYFTVDGGAPMPVVPDDGGGFVVEYLFLPEGDHVIQLTATNSLGLTTTRQQTVTVDVTRPVITIVSPEMDSTTGALTTVTSVVEDATPTQVVTQWTETSTLPSGSGTVSHQVSLVSGNDNYIMVLATDAAGNQTETYVRVYVSP